MFPLGLADVLAESGNRSCMHVLAFSEGAIACASERADWGGGDLSTRNRALGESAGHAPPRRGYQSHREVALHSGAPSPRKLLERTPRCRVTSRLKRRTELICPRSICCL